MNDYIDNYCERIEPGLWAEPLNAVTNLGFLIGAVLVWRLARREQRLTPSVMLLVSFLVAICIGSGLFHTFATGWAQLLDVVPIGIFQVTFLWLYLRRIIDLRWLPALAIMAAFFASGWLAGQFPHLLNGSLGYAPALLFIGGLAIWHRQHCAREPNALLLALMLFSIALTFRTMDQAICPYWPIGTHFFWHLCNSGVLYLSMRGLILNLGRYPLRHR